MCEAMNNPFARFSFKEEDTSVDSKATKRLKKQDGIESGRIFGKSVVSQEDVYEETKRLQYEEEPEVTLKLEMTNSSTQAECSNIVEPKYVEDDDDSVAEPRIKLLKALFQARQHITAPVDMYGTHALVDYTASKPTQRFHALVAAMLSSQTRDEVTAGAMTRLHGMEGGGLSINSVLRTSEVTIDALLNPVGFHRKKAQYLKSIASILHTKHQDDVPKNLSDLISLPGIGPKIARLILLVAWNIVEGIIVDTHVHRISDRLGFTSGCKNPEATREELEQWIPPQYYGEVSKAMIGFGQTVCSPQRPKCTTCPLAMRCPSAHKIKGASIPKR